MQCGYCFEEGHNVKSCTKLTETVQKSPGGYTHSRYRKYFNDDGTRKKTSVTRTCSYCSEPGHTRRTCDVKLNDMVANIKTNAEYRRDMYNFLKEKGAGVGSLVTMSNKMYLITGIQWDNFTCGDNRWNATHLDLHSVSGDSTYTKFAIDQYIIQYHRDAIKVESPEHDIPEPSSEWFSGKSKFYEDFKGRVSNPFRFEPRRF